MIAGSTFYRHGSQIFERPAHSAEARVFAIVHPSRHDAAAIAGLLVEVLNLFAAEIQSLSAEERAAEVASLGDRMRPENIGEPA